MSAKPPKVPSYSHDPDAVLDYVWDWTDFLTGDDTIASATVVASTIADDTAALTVTLVANSDTTVTAWVSGGTLGNSYLLTCHIVTADGREEDRTASLEIQSH